MKAPNSSKPGSRITRNYGAQLRNLLVALTAMALQGPTLSFGASIIKADTPDNLTVGTSWVGGVVPTSSDIAVWDSTVSAANTTDTLGADTNWLGLSITSPGALVTINAGNTLTLGGSGIDMSAASQGLALACPVNLGASQIWNVGTGRGLTNSG